jgi:hypothetical protein
MDPRESLGATEGPQGNPGEVQSLFVTNQPPFEMNGRGSRKPRLFVCVRRIFVLMMSVFEVSHVEGCGGGVGAGRGGGSGGWWVGG